MPGKFSRLLLCFLILLSSNSGISQIYQLMGTNADDLCQSGCVLKGGSYVSFGSTGSGTAEDALIYLIDSWGKVQKTVQFGGTAAENGMSVCSTHDGGFAVTGNTRSSGAGGRDIYVGKFNSTGDIQWIKTFGGSSDEESFEIIETSDRGFLIAGYTRSYGHNSYNSYILKLTETGKVQWNKVLHTGSFDAAFRVVQIGNAYYVSNNTNISNAFGRGDIFITKLDINGNLIWNKSYGTTQNEQPWKLIPTLDGNMAMVSASVGFSGGPNKELILIKLDTTGKIQFCSRVVNSGRASDGFDLVQDKDSNYIVVGHAMDNLSEWKGAVFKFDKTGDLIASGYANFSTEGNIWKIHKKNSGFVMFGNAILNIKNNRDFLFIYSDSSLKISCQNWKTLNAYSSPVSLGEKLLNSFYQITSGVSEDTAIWNIGVNNTKTEITELNYSKSLSSNLPDYQGYCSLDSVWLDPGKKDLYLWENSSTKRLIKIDSFSKYRLKFWSNYCIGYDSTEIFKMNPPKLSLRGDTCTSGPVTLEVQNISSWKYLWSTGGMKNKITVQGKGTYSVSITDTLRKCMVTDSMTVYNPGMVSFIVYNTLGQCKNGNLLEASLFEQLHIPNDRIVKYRWYNENTLIDSLPILKYSADTNGAFNIRVFVTSKFGCSDTQAVLYKVYPNPKADFRLIDTIVCQNENVAAIHTDSSIVKKTWVSLPDGVQNNRDTFVTIFKNTGINFLKLTVENSQGCSDSAVKPIEILESPTLRVSLNSDSVQCLKNNQFEWTDSSYNLSGKPVFRNWNMDDGTVYNSGKVTHKYTIQSEFKPRLKITNSAGCSDSAIWSIRINPMPVAMGNLHVTSSCLEKNQFTLTNLSSVSGGTVWSRIYLDDGRKFDLIDSIVFSYTEAKKYFPSIIAETDKGCTDTHTFSIQVLASPVLEIHVDKAIQCFKGNSFSFIGNNLKSDSSDSYNWDFNDGSSSTQKNPVHSFNFSDTFRVKLHVQNGAGCTDTTSETITVYPNPVAIYSPVTACLGMPVNLAHQSRIQNGVISYAKWGVNGSFYPGNNITLLIPQVGVYPVSLLVQSEKGCTDSMEISDGITIRSRPVASTFWIKEYEGLEKDVWLVRGNVGAGLKHNWMLGNTESGNNPELRINVTDTFTAKLRYIVTDDYGCSDTLLEHRHFPFYSNVFIPSAFTPNGDDKNKVFRPEINKPLTAYNLYIYNRWGQQIFSTSDVYTGWDGTFRGLDVPEGLYVYRITIGSAYDFGGTVHLLR